MQTKLDKAFKIIVDISNRKVTIPQAISWYVTDENIAHLNCQIIDEVEDSIIDIQSYKLSMRVLTPSKILKEVNYTLSDATNNIFTLTLPDELITEKGRHQCELSIEYLGDKLTSEPFNYNIIQSIANQLDSTISKDSHYPLVLELEDKLKEWNNILDEQVSKVIILNNDVTNAEKTRQANEAQRIADEAIRAEFYDGFNDRLDSVDSQLVHNANEVSYMNSNLTNNKINVKFPPKVEFEGSMLEGLKCDGTDQFEKFLRLCRYVKQKTNYLGGAVMYFPSGTYTFSKIPMYSYISIIGDGKRNTIFKPVKDSSSTELFYINEAPVQFSTYANFTVDCVSENINQTCFNIYAQYLGTSTGGCWYCNFNNIEIKNFKNGFKFSAEKNSYDIANQFLNFNDVVIYRPNNLDSRCILGGGNQFTYTSCEFSCPKSGSIGTNIETSGHCNFIMLTCQNADYGIVITSGKVNIYNAWFENVKYSITDKSTTSTNTVIDVFGGTFANAGYDGNNSGYIAKTESINTRINLYSPTIKGSCDKVYVDKYDTQNGIYLYGSKSINNKTSHKTRQVSTLEDIGTLFSSKTILINGNGIIKNIDEKYENGDMITIKCLGDVTVKKGGNIGLDKDINLSISDTITLVKSDLGSKWFIVSIFKNSMY